MLDINILAAWGEFIGGIAVVVSLIYLASQIRQNSRLLRASATSTTAQLHMGQNEMIANSPEVALLFKNGVSGRDSLSEAERHRFDAMISIQIQAMHQSFEFQEKGMGSEASWCFTDTSMRWMVAQPGFRSYWLEQSRWPQAHIPAFRDWVDGLIREGEAAE